MIVDEMRMVSVTKVNMKEDELLSKALKVDEERVSWLWQTVVY